VIMPVMTAQQLSKRYGKRVALDQVSLSVSAGAIHGLLGPNGSGKTTALHVITGLIEPDSGAVEVDGLNITEKLSRANLGFAPDDLPLPTALTGREFLTLHDALRSRDDRDRAELLAEALGIGADLEEMVGNYSHGMQRKIQLIAAVMHNPALLILDEPFRGLDPESAATVRGLIFRFVSGGGGVLIATHDMLRAERDCHAVSILARGRIVASGAPSELIAAHPGSDNLEGAFLRATGRDESLPLSADLVELALSVPSASSASRRASRRNR
jgi:ABC-2 type transport system ATP-binding protein